MRRNTIIPLLAFITLFACNNIQQQQGESEDKVRLRTYCRTHSVGGSLPRKASSGHSQCDSARCRTVVRRSKYGCSYSYSLVFNIQVEGADVPTPFLLGHNERVNQHPPSVVQSDRAEQKSGLHPDRSPGAYQRVSASRCQNQHAHRLMPRCHKAWLRLALAAIVMPDR